MKNDNFAKGKRTVLKMKNLKTTILERNNLNQEKITSKNIKNETSEQETFETIQF